MSTPSLYDRGFQFGDGLFETIRAQNGELQAFDLHWQRFKRGAEVLGIRLPAKRILEMRCKALAKPPVVEGEDEQSTSPVLAIKLQATRGDSASGYASAETLPANIYASVRPVALNPLFWQQGIALRWCEQTLAIQPQLAGIKHCNRLEQVLARREWQHEVQEGLMCDTEGYVVEGTSTNVFAYIDGRWKTPLLDRCGVTGTMRQQILDWMAENEAPVSETRISVTELESADSLFVCNAIVGPWPVARLAEASKTLHPLMSNLVAAFAPPH